MDAGRFRLEGVSKDHPATQIALALVSDHQGDVRCIGTAFGVAPGLAITAAHVVQDWIDYQRDRDGYKMQGSSFAVAGFQLFNDRLLQWDVDAFYKSNSADVAFLRFKRPPWWGDGSDQVKPSYARLNFNPPEIGEQLCVFGFPNSEVKDGILVVSPSECMAQVTRVDIKSDIRIRPASYLEMRGEIEGGMSGGPCFDKDWNVVAVNSKGWLFAEGDPISYAALLWPGMSLEIDLFKNGAFPAIEIFNKGAACAIGYRRIHIMSSGTIHFAKTDPDSLVPLPPFGNDQVLSDALNFSGGNAQKALAEIGVLIDEASNAGKQFQPSNLFRALRHYFWELDSVIKLAIRLKSVKIGLDLGAVVEWERFVSEWRKLDPSSAVKDELALLEFSWQGVELFELRQYAELCRSGVLIIESALSLGDGRAKVVVVGACRVNGSQIILPDGLNRFADSTRKFVQQLLLSDQQIETNKRP